MTNNFLVINQGTVFGTKTGLMASVVQGEVGKVLVIDIVDQAGTDFPITGATDISASMTTPAGDTTAVTGTISVVSGGLSWDLSSGDVGTDGEFSLIVQFTLNGDIYKTHPVRWIIIADPEETAVQNPSITGVSELEATWLTAEKAGTEAAAAGEILQSDGDNSEGSGYQTATSLRQHNFTATAAPGVGDDTADGYAPGSRWIDVTNDKEYVCLDASAGAAVWEEKASASDLTTHEALTTTAHGGLLPQDTLILSKTEAYEVAAGDAGKTIECSGTFTVTFPNGLDTGFQVTIVNVGAGVITLSAATTLTSDGTQLATQYTGAVVYHAGSNIWRAFGRLT